MVRRRVNSSIAFEKQWKNHEQSKKHKEKVAELRESFLEEEKEENDEEAPETVEELHENLGERLNIDDEEVEEKDVDETDDEYFMAEEDLKESSESEDEENADYEMSLLNKMVSEQKNKLKNVVSRKEDEVVVENENDTAEFREGNNTDDNVNATDSASGAFEATQKDEEQSVEYDNRKSTGKRRRSKKGKDKNNLGGLMEKRNEADNTQGRNGDMEESHSETFEDRSEYIEHKKAPRSKKSTKGMKSKGTSKKTSSNECDRCGEGFESRLVHETSVLLSSPILKQYISYHS
ncbi:unnamed protein product [Eruca vesicaria subsp. sativa]|uniref:Uncharacterized protein n=1 Tax=Eruca vesicaria subsp. sativa TaxID=29727 RepID=A0ABC8IUF0_ERUVS|nr:unnamed protein product [Eruca vesicaria subsp. sativa]